MSCGMSSVFNVVYSVSPPVQRDIRSGTFYQYKKPHLPCLQLHLMVVSQNLHLDLGQELTDANLSPD